MLINLFNSAEHEFNGILDPNLRVDKLIMLIHRKAVETGSTVSIVANPVNRTLMFLLGHMTWDIPLFQLSSGSSPCVFDLLRTHVGREHLAVLLSDHTLPEYLRGVIENEKA